MSISGSRARLSALFIALSVAILRLRPISDPDYHWHLATGRFIARTRSIPTADPFSHTFAGAPWTFVDWVSDLAMYAIRASLGDTAVVVFFALVGALALSTVYARIELQTGEGSAKLTVLLLVSAAVFFRITPRPQTLTLLFVALILLALDRMRTRPKLAIAVPLLVALWQNMHGSAVLGVAVVLAYLLGAMVERREERRLLLATAIASAFALFLAFHPLARLAAGFTHLGDPRVGRLFPEWGHAFRPGAFGLPVIALLVLLLLALIGARERASRDLGQLLAGLGLGLLGLLSLRFLPLAAIALASPALVGLRALPRASIVGPVLGAALLFAQARKPGIGLERGMFPERAAALLQAEHLEGKLFNDFEQGGYLIWTLGPEHWPDYVDGRSMALFGAEFVEQTASAVGAVLEEKLRRYDVSIVVIAPDIRAGFLHRSNQWLLVGFDDTSAVFVRKRDAGANAERLAYRAILPVSWYDLGRLDPTRLAAARAEAERAVAEAPDSTLAAVTRIAVTIASGDLAAAETQWVEASAKFPDAQRVMRAGLMRCLAASDGACACSRARSIERQYPRNSYTAEVIAKYACPR